MTTNTNTKLILSFTLERETKGAARVEARS